MELYLLRHGIAEDRSPDGSDEARRLTEDGRARLEATKAGLARLRVRPERLLTSPLVRARQTAQIVGAHLGLAPEVAEALAPGCRSEHILGLLAERLGSGAVLAVGHEPDLSQIVLAITGARCEMKKGALARIDLAPGAAHGTLTFLVPPRGLR